MDTTTVLGVAVGVLALVVVVLCVLVGRLSQVVRSIVETPPPARAAVAAAPPEPADGPRREVEPAPAEHVITRLGEPDDQPGVVPNQVVLSATLGEPLVRTLALAHGVRRALGAEARNRIRFEMRREVKRARKDRRREMRAAWRQVRAQESAQKSAQESVQQSVPQQRREDVA